MGLILSIVGLFTGKFAKYAWGLLGIFVFVAAILSGIMWVKHLQSDNESLKIQNSSLTKSVQDSDHKVELLQTDQQNLLDRANAIQNEVGNLQNKVANNAAQRQTDLDNIVTKPGSNSTLNQIASKANTGTNDVFHQLEAASREGIDDKSK
jgi:FtsZ-binding cell division protein ZapB